MSPKPIMTISKQFFLLFLMIFSLIISVLAILSYQFRQVSQAGSMHAQNLKVTFSLNQKLRAKIGDQLTDLLLQFEIIDPLFLSRLRATNFDLEEIQNQYLNLRIDEKERLTVEDIRSLQAEMAIRENRTYEELRAGRHESALVHLRQVQEIERKAGDALQTLNDLQMGKLSLVIDHLALLVNLSAIASYAMSGGLILALGLFTFLLNKRVFRPLSVILAAADKIRQGNLAARASIVRVDEIGRLARGINFMAESLEESYAQMERKVEERTQQLQQLQQRMIQSEKMSAVGQLVAGVAHELNNPLTTIMGFSELAQMDHSANGGRPDEIKLMEDIHAQADRCRRIVANLLQFSRQRLPAMEPMKVNAAIESVLQLRERELEARNIRLVRRFNPGDPVICADPNKIQQVVLNLLNNAHDAIAERGAAGTIWICTSLQGGRLEIEVKDTGPGIKALERIFDPFYTTKEVGKGTGLGLSVCYGIVQEHGGEIRAENWEGGARILISLPTGDPAALPGKKEARREDVVQTATGSQRKALLIDDEPQLLRLQASYLRKLGVEAVTQSNGEKALEYLKTHAVDIVVSDVRMPGAINGIALYRWIRENRPGLARRFLFVSGDLIEMNCGDFFLDDSVPRIQKPFMFEEYAQAIRQVLQN